MNNHQRAKRREEEVAVKEPKEAMALTQEELDCCEDQWDDDTFQDFDAY